LKKTQQNKKPTTYKQFWYILSNEMGFKKQSKKNALFSCVQRYTPQSEDLYF